MSSARRIITSTSSILNNLENKGYSHILPKFYIGNSNLSHLQSLLKSFNELNKDPSHGNRFRSYCRFMWNPTEKLMVKDTANEYMQTKKYNEEDGDKVRQFDFISDSFISNPIIKEAILKNIELARLSNIVKFDSSLELGLHQIRYNARMNQPSYSSPVWLHKDDEPLVFVHLFNITKNLLGGDNLISPDKSEITDMVRLRKPMETLVVNQKVFHAVTPMSSSNHQPSGRDILLVTFQNKSAEAPKPTVDEKQNNANNQTDTPKSSLLNNSATHSLSSTRSIFSAKKSSENNAVINDSKDSAIKPKFL